MTRETQPRTGRTVQEGQLFRDLDRYMDERDRHLRVNAIGPDGRALCAVEHGLHEDGRLVGRTAHIHVRNLGSPASSSCCRSPTPSPRTPATPGC